MKTSVILATYNWEQALEIVLSYLLEQIKEIDEVEIIIADDGSNINTLSLIEKYQNKYSKIKHVWHEDIGFRKSIILNRAVFESSGDYLIFLDGDCVPFPDFIGEHLKLQESGYMVAGNRVLLSKKFTQQIVDKPDIIRNIVKWKLLNWLYAKVVGNVNKILPRIKLDSRKWRYKRKTDWTYPKGCNFAMFRNDFIKVNGFDESFFGWGHEDADLFVRLLNSGIRIKDGKFSVPVLHLWHGKENRDKEQDNWNKLISRVNDKNYTRAKVGIDKYYEVK